MSTGWQRKGAQARSNMCDQLAPFLTPAAAAEMLRCSTKTIEDRLRAGDLPGEKFGEGWILPTEAFVQRVNEIALEKMLQRRKARNPLPPVAVAVKSRLRQPPPLPEI